MRATAQPWRLGHGESADLAYVDQGYTDEKAEGAAAGHGILLEQFKLAGAKRGFVLLPRRWAEAAKVQRATAIGKLLKGMDRSFAWRSRFRRRARDYGRCPETITDMHPLGVAMLMLKQTSALALCHNSL